MQDCYFCHEPAAGRCGVCNTPACSRHLHAVNRWHNVFHARQICEGCFLAKERKRKYVLIPLVLLFALLIAKSMGVKWGLAEPSTWSYFFALSSVALGVTGISTVYNAITRSGKALNLLKWFLAVLPAWIVFYSLYSILR